MVSQVFLSWTLPLLDSFSGGSICTYRHENVPSVGEVESAENQARLAGLVTIDPALAEYVPLALEDTTELTAILGVQGCEKNGNRVVAGGRRELPVGVVLELQGRKGHGLGVECLKAVGRGGRR